MRRDNIQRLARRLRIHESDLLALSATVEWRAPDLTATPATRPPAHAEPADERPTRPPAEESASLSQLEAGLLRLLLQEPRRLQEIDALLRQLQPAEEDGPAAAPLRQLYFGDFGMDDFVQNDHRAFITLLREALQREEEPTAYLHAQSEGAQLGPMLTALLEEELDWLGGRLRFGLAQDLQLHRRRHPPDAGLEQEQERDMLCGALDLRRRRLIRMVDEIHFYLEESDADVREINRQLSEYQRARRLLDERLARLRGRPGSGRAAGL